MSTILSGKEVAAALRGTGRARCEALAQRGVAPTLAVLRVGANDADGSYLRALQKACVALGVRLTLREFPADRHGEAALFAALAVAARDPAVHGILLLRPLPQGFDEPALLRLIPPEKDADGATDRALASTFLGSDALAPCTAAACMEILRFYRIPLRGRRAVVIGRSAVVGRPLGALLLGQDATVTLCHSRTADVPALCREADVLVAAAGRRGLVTADYVKPGAVVLDVGIHWDAARNRLVGDVEFDAVAPLAGAITPVPGGVGAVTSTVLALRVITFAERSLP